MKDFRSSTEIEKCKQYADKVAPKGSVMHFAIRLGFLPLNEEMAEEIIERCILELEYSYDIQ